tara:strand:+ start:184 stop:777 length:594 start_codon:yes stop_codon:yes gene_type:complete
VNIQRHFYLNCILLACLLLHGCQNNDIGEVPEPSSVPTVSDVIPLDEVKPSQSGSIFQAVANTEINVTYDRPVARGRELFGGIVPYDEIWNPGANDATKVSFSRSVTVNGFSLQKGDYSIWMIPGRNEWKVMFNRAADVYHQPYPGEEHEELRLTVIPRIGEHMETLAFYFSTVEKKDAELRMHWGDTIILLAISVP